MEITSIDQLDLSKTYSYADYLLWRFEERLELIKGKIFAMSPAPNRRHQVIAREILFELNLHFKKHECELFFAPFDVRLPIKDAKPTDKKIYNVVQPDLCVICDEAKLDKKGCIGAPDLIIEILSPGNSKKEMLNKFQLYEEAGVKEYWIVEPQNEIVLVYYLNDAGKYIGLPPAVDVLTSGTFSGLTFSLTEIWEA
jgi:Uma2 family endonuclease